MMSHDRANLPDGFKTGPAWGSSFDPDYEAVADRLRPLF
jgi:hypothetical protein